MSEWLTEWETPPFKSNGSGPVSGDTMFPPGVLVKSNRFVPPGKPDGEWEYYVDLYIQRSAKELKMDKPYNIIGEFVFSGTENATKKKVRNVVPFSRTIHTEKTCEWFIISFSVPKDNNELWPEYPDARIRVATKLASSLVTDSFGLALKAAKESYDMWLLGADGKAVGLHSCVARMHWSSCHIQKNVSLKVGSQKSIQFVIDLTYETESPQLMPIELFMEIYDICIHLGFNKYLFALETKIANHLQDNLNEINKLVSKYPNSKTFLDQKVKLIGKDIASYVAEMDRLEQEKS